MNRKIRVVLGLLTLIVAPHHTEGGTYQESEDPLRLAAEAIGAMNVEILRYSGSGSSYTFGRDADGEETRHYERVTAYVHEVDHLDGISHLQAIRLTGESPSDETDNRRIDSNTPWEIQVALWMNPHFFLQKAISEHARVEAVTEQGSDYTLASFETPGGHLVSGYIDRQNILRKIRTQLEHPLLGDRTVEGSFLYYEEFGDIQFPTVVVHKQNGSPSLILVVRDVDQESS